MNSWSNSPTDLFLALVSPTPPRLEAAPETDWEEVLRLAERHWLAPLLHARLKPLLEQLPESVSAALHEAHASSMAQTMVNEWQQAQVVDALHARGIPLILYKGMPLARALFGDAALRPSTDIDLIVHRADLEPSHRLLESLEWEQKEEWRAFNDHDGDSIKEYAYRKKVAGGTVALELHWRNQRKGEYHLPESRLWEETVETEAGHLLTREMTLLTLTLHALSHAYRPYRHFVDIAHASSAWHESVDWERVVALAEEAGALPILAVGLALAHRDLGAPLPPHPRLIRQMRCRRTRWVLKLLSSRRLLHGRSYGDVERYLVPVLVGDRQPARYFLPDLIRTPRQIARIYGLAPNSPLIPLYYLLRPFLLTKKYLSRFRSRRP